MIEIWGYLYNEIGFESSAYKRLQKVHNVLKQRFIVCNKSIVKRFMRKEKVFYDVVLSISDTCHEVILHGATERQISVYFLGLLNGQYWEKENSRNNEPTTKHKSDYCDKCMYFNGKRYCRMGMATTVTLNKKKCKHKELSKLANTLEATK